ncbi:MAG: BamA/TamA family outer membrane protein [Coprobacter sp.]|nr:BamA/TamA family outer membrane protein [Coprobacter sp.]
MRLSGKKYIRPAICILIALLTSCRTTRHVGPDEYLLNRVSVKTDNSQVKPGELRPYIKQEPNHKTFGIIGLPLFFYNLSGKDTTRWFNRWLQKIGTPPVIYDSTLMLKSQLEIKKALNNRGYVRAVVTADTVSRRRKMKVRYNVTANEPYHIERISYNIDNENIARIVLRDTASLLLKPGMLFDRTLLDEERQRISNRLRNNGYYAFNKEYITYTADTTIGDNGVELELNLMPIPIETGTSEMIYRKHDTYRIREVYFVTNYDGMNLEPEKRFDVQDSLIYKGYHIWYGNKRYLKEETLVNNCFIRPGTLFRNRDIDRTYTAFSRLKILKYVNIRFVPVKSEEVEMLDCYILLTEGKGQTISVDIEGTNSAGDLGFALGLTHQHRNIFRGSQTLTTKFRGAYESMSGKISGIINDHYTEFGGEIGITLPEFLFPVMRSSVRKRWRATTEFDVNINFQQRPEYTRVIAGGGWNYKWTTHRNQYNHQLDLVDISYIYLPKTSNDFLNNLPADNPLLRNSYENHFIMRSSYVFYRSNLDPVVKSTHNIYTLRVAGEIAGNLLYGISSLSKMKPGPYGEYSILGIRYSQYAKADADYAYTFVFNERNSLSLHSGVGIEIPYGNSEILPFEKRYFAGGANSVRGWSVRTLGPGRYKGINRTLDFMNQCGDIRLDLNAEYRSKLIWKLELAAFIDAGNIWTIKDYESQPGGQFKLNRFYKEIALAYGLGLRFDFNYFLLRFDLGMKAFDPGMADDRQWVLVHPRFKRDAAFHFAVGYPF